VEVAKFEYYGGALNLSLRLRVVWFNCDPPKMLGGKSSQMKRTMRSRSLLSFVAIAVVELVSAAFLQIAAAAAPPPGFKAVTQLGPEDTSAIEIAPNRSWFLTGTQVAIVVRDMTTGGPLREMTPGGFARFTRMAISADGHVVFARLARDTVDDTETMGWSAETGSPIENAAALAPPLDGNDWTWISHLAPSSWPFQGPHDLQAEKKYLADQQLASLVSLENVERIEPSNHQDVIQVTTSGEVKDEAEETGWAYHVYFIDVARKKIVADASGRTLRTFCGKPHGTYAFDGQHLLLAPTELDASHSNIDALLVDTRSVPPVLKWSRPCQDTQVSGVGFRRGLIVVSATPDQVTLWDPATARRIVHIDDIYDSDVFEWSTDLTTFATGFHERRTVADPDTYGVAAIRSGNKLFFPTDTKVSEIRLGEDGSKVFARTNSGWSAWDTSNGAKLSSFAVPAAADEISARGLGPRKSPDGKFEIVKDQLVETATGRVLVQARPILRFSEDFRYVWGMGPVSIQTIRLWETASGRLLWQATANDGAANRDFLIVQHADGRVLVSEGAEDLVKFVRGFEVRPFGALRRQ
jgi:hypothetical protein